MSERTSGTVSRGKQNEQVTITFSGKLDQAQWDAFVQSVKQLAGGSLHVKIEGPGPAAPEARKPKHT